MHVTHFKKADVKRVTNELEREPECNNADGRVDPKRTKDNYTMRPRRFHYQLNSDVERRLNHVEHSSRKDLNVMSSWVITCPQELSKDPKKVKQFFTVAFDFMCDRYGAENVLNGYVHMDEATPHMHMPMVPVKDGRVSAKALFTRSELRAVHKDLEKRMQSEFGVKGLILNGRTKGKYSVKELKARTVAEKDLQARQKALEASERALRTKQHDLALKEQEQALRASERLRELSEREKDLEQRENTLAKKSKDFNKTVDEAMATRDARRRCDGLKGAPVVHHRGEDEFSYLNF